MAAPHLAADLSGDKQKYIFVDHMCQTLWKAYSGKKHDIQENYEVCFFRFWENFIHSLTCVKFAKYCIFKLHLLELCWHNLA